jgi:vancomycin resistance protein YoaR
MSSRRSLIGGVVGATAAAVAIALPARSSGEMYPDTRVQGVDVSGLSRKESETLLRNAFAPLEAYACSFTFEDKEWRASLLDLGITVEYQKMLDDAFAHGRSINPFERYATLASQGDPRNVPIQYSINEDTFGKYLAALDSEIRIEPVNAQLARRGTDVEIVKERIGRTLDLDHARQATNDALATGRAMSVALKTLDVQPNLYADQLEAAREEATLLIADPIVFTHEDVTYDFDTNELAGALTIKEGGEAALDLEKLKERMTAIADDASIPPVNVKLGWDSGIYVVEDDVDGLGVNMDEFGKRILAASRSTDARTVELPTEVVKAPARTDNVDELGITEHLASGSSLYTGSNETRAANVLAAANNISYKMVGPGETFSFNEQMGRISVENGFVEGKIISGDWTASDLGGGVCQVSTTVFRAAFFAGFRFSEWNHHGWRLPFYETDGSPPGLDAAIYQAESEWEAPAEKDLKFINPLDSWLLLMMLHDNEEITAHLYGRPNGWTVEVGEARISDPIKPGDPVVKENPEAPRGSRKMVKKAQDGYDVSIRRTVKDANGEIVSDGDFTSNYRAQPEVWEVGPS